MIYDNIILGAGPSSLQLAYYFQKNNINYIVIEKESTCASFFYKYPHTNNLISLNKKYTGNTNKDFNLRHDWNSLLNDEDLLFSDYSDELYPPADMLYKYLNDFYNKFKLNILFNTTIEIIDKIDGKYILKNSENTFTCNKLIVATGLSKPVYPFKNLDYQLNHYGDYEKGYFINEENLKKYINKKILIVGAGNAAFELANLLQKYCATIIILGAKKQFSIVTHYVGDIRSIYMNFLDTFYLKSLNGIDTANKEDLSNCKLIRKTEDNGSFKYKIIGTDSNTYYSSTPDLEWYDDIICCTGWTFNTSIFNFKLNMTINNKYPEINNCFESSNNENLYFIGSLMHSIDYRKGSGGFIHGFRYLIKLFTQLKYNIPKDITTFKFTGNMDCYKSLSEHIFNRINYSSSLYQLYGTMCDIFFYDKDKKEIVYIENWKLDCIKELNIPGNHVNAVLLDYGEQEQLISRLGSFNKWNPRFLHPKIFMFNYFFNKLDMIDRVIFEEDLIADFKDKNTLNKIYQVTKMCNLIM